MPCIFCIAAITLVAGAIAAATADRMESALSEQAAGPVRRTVDTDSVAKWELDVTVGSTSVPVAVTLFKDSGRVRIQVLSHALSPEQVQELFALLCAAMGAELVSQSTREDEAHGEHDTQEDTDADPDPAPPQRSATSDPQAAPRRRQ
jgi:hypothetical protein